ncbi:hypothetical protein [Sphingopyxis terrae]|uniref:hypothetical protein n=1 Tax=Sphingopyxis terrae TaxID=33052 RepID=UPI003627F108
MARRRRGGVRAGATGRPWRRHGPDGAQRRSPEQAPSRRRVKTSAPGAHARPRGKRATSGGACRRQCAPN